MSIYKKFLKYVEEGRKGENRGIPMGYPRLDKFLKGIQRKKYYLLGAETGCGKTALADEAFIINPYNWIVKNNAKESLKIFYYSFEIDVDSKLSKWVSYQIFKDHQIELDSEHIVGMDMEDENDVKNKLSDANFELVKHYEEHFEKMFEFIEFEDIPINPTRIYNQVKRYCEEHGTWVKYERKVEGKMKEVKYYKPNNKNEYVEVIIDHYALIKSESEKGIKLTKKLSMDKLSAYLIELRNIYGVIPIVISQFNRELGDIQRAKFKELTPQLTDFKETGNSQEDANVVFGLMHPKRHNITNYLDYDLTGKGGVIDCFRALFLIKNRGGRDGLSLPLRFQGVTGHFEELPSAEEMNKKVKLYSKIPDFTKTFSEHVKEMK